MRIVEIVEPPTADARADALALVERVESATGVPALSDHLRLDLRSAGVAGPLLVTVSERGATIAFAQVSDANDTSLIEVVVAPDTPDALAVRDDALETALAVHRRRGGRPPVWWLDDPSEHDIALAATLGLAPTRELYEMRRPLPHPEQASITTRSFVPGADDEAFLRVNNRAFAEHGEQGGWTRSTLQRRIDEAWFDADGFRLHEVDGDVVAFCWTKLHHDLDPVIGEIYVIAVDPTAHGRGLGRQLTLAGLDAITERGVGVANLYVDADNAAAVRLYDRLGFTVHRRRVAFGDLATRQATP